MNNQVFSTAAEEVAGPPPKKQAKPLTSRLRKSQNFWKVDRELDDYIDRTKLIKSGPKRLLKKLLLLRGREDTNEVKTTASGLCRLLNVNIKTIREWLRQLEAKEFIYYQGEIWDPHCNFPKKKYIFAHTFPGFDAGAVFIQKGAKAKYKERKAKKANARPAVKGRICKHISVRNTCPVSPRLLDCSTHCIRGTRNIKEEEDTKVSSSPTSPSSFMISVTSTGLRPAKPVRCPSRNKDTGKATIPRTVLDCSPQLRSLLTTMLVQAHDKGKVQWLSNFIDDCVRENGSIQTWEDIHELADELFYAIPKQFTPKRGKTLISLFQFLREYISNHVGKSYYRSGQHWPNLLNYQWEEARQDFFKRYPSCLPDPETGRETGVNR